MYITTITSFFFFDIINIIVCCYCYSIDAIFSFWGHIIVFILYLVGIIILKRLLISHNHYYS